MSTEELGGAKVVRLEGALDVAAALELRDLLETVLEPGTKVLLDLAAPPGPVDRVFDLTRTDRLLRIFPTVAEGLAALAG